MDMVSSVVNSGFQLEVERLVERKEYREADFSADRERSRPHSREEKSQQVFRWLGGSGDLKE